MDDICLFKLTSSHKLAKEVADILQIPLGHTEINHFADGEVLARSPDSVRGKIVYVIQSTSKPVCERLMELLIFVDGLRNAKAKEINLVIPYYGFARQDRIARPGEPISAKLVADLLNTVGISRVITLDLHTPQTQGFFSCPVDNLSSIPLFGEHFRSYYKKKNIPTSQVTVISPDHGALNRARDLASELPDSSIAIIDKRRPAPNVAEVINLIGEVKNRHCLIIDDIIDTAGTALACAEALKEQGAASISIAGTHPVFSAGSIEKLTSGYFDHVVTTNSIEHDPSQFEVLSIAPMIAGLIKANLQGEAVPDSWLSFY